MSITEKNNRFSGSRYGSPEKNVRDYPPILAEQSESKRNSQAVRWYVLTLPSCHRGPAVGLQRELDRRIRCGEPEFEFFAPRTWK